MPTHIYCDIDEDNPFDTVAGFDGGEDAWELHTQIGFTLREGASGGGAVMSRKLIAMLHEVGMEVYFSEYWLT